MQSGCAKESGAAEARTGFLCLIWIQWGRQKEIMTDRQGCAAVAAASEAAEQEIATTKHLSPQQLHDFDLQPLDLRMGIVSNGQVH
mmetsp:Transcript_34853/g.51038  ORF Transcript_34853/g.51038 Transcript_34853/m.51038 type:complete len:86 (+) Transcript_34853:857-1114(+)